MKNKKRNLKWIGIFAALMILIVVGSLGYRYWEKHRVFYYRDDYAKDYEKQLEIIFGPDYEISEKERIVIEGEVCGCGWYTNGVEYDRWEITYKDQYGREFTQILSNKESLETQQLTWLEEQLEQYYKQKYMIEYFEERTFEDLSLDNKHGRTYCFMFWASRVSSYTMDKEKEFHRIEKLGRQYKKELLSSLQNEENMICLYDLNYEEIFNRFPLEIHMGFSIDDSELTGEEQAKFEKNVQAEILEMMDAVNEETGFSCNLDVYVRRPNGADVLYDGAKDWRYYIIRGNKVEKVSDFNWECFYAYEGIFW